MLQTKTYQYFSSEPLKTAVCHWSFSFSSIQSKRLSHGKKLSYKCSHGLFQFSLRLLTSPKSYKFNCFK